ncbi:hypothetical protein THIOKS1670013 [Thiocapsa sp. KS1]|nr:hypothetical protein THIOKS1670013 [Thiocapsa sp. KS1]
MQTMPGKGYSVIRRFYGSLEPWFDQTLATGRHREGEVIRAPRACVKGAGTGCHAPHVSGRACRGPNPKWCVRDRDSTLGRSHTDRRFKRHT